MISNQIHILHIENDAVEAELFQELLLQELGSKDCEFTLCTTLQEGLTKLKDNSFDVVLLDLGLDDISGMDNVRAVIEENRDCPVVVLSGHDNKEMAIEAIKLGAQEYVIKGYGNGRVLSLAVLSSIERKAYERHLFKLANSDELTGLSNRRMFSEYLKRQLLRAQR